MLGTDDHAATVSTSAAPDAGGTPTVRPASGTTPRDTGVVTRGIVADLALLLGATAATLVFARLNTIVANAAIGIVGTAPPLVAGLIFSAFPFLLASVIVVRDPARYGVQLGRTRERLPLVVGTIAAMVVLTVIALAGAPRTPFSGADFVIEVVSVPVSEELLFRGVLFTLVLMVLARRHAPGTSVALAAVISGVAFGIGHLNNLDAYQPSFVLQQAVFATILGVVAGRLRGSTDSVYPAILLHAAVNLVAVLM